MFIQSYQAFCFLNQDLKLSKTSSIFSSIFFFKARPVTTIAELTTHVFTSKPVAPADWNKAKAEPATTFPIED